MSTQRTTAGPSSAYRKPIAQEPTGHDAVASAGTGPPLAGRNDAAACAGDAAAFTGGPYSRAVSPPLVWPGNAGPTATLTGAPDAPLAPSMVTTRIVAAGSRRDVGPGSADAFVGDATAGGAAAEPRSGAHTPRPTTWLEKIEIRDWPSATGAGSSTTAIQLRISVPTARSIVTTCGRSAVRQAIVLGPTDAVAVVGLTLAAARADGVADPSGGVGRRPVVPSGHGLTIATRTNSARAVATIRGPRCRPYGRAVAVYSVWFTSTPWRATRPGGCRAA